MSVCAVMLVKDEADIIDHTIRHLESQVDHIIVADNRSSDGTRSLLEGLPVELRDDPDPAYYQSAKTTALAIQALEQGHAWVVPCDADEVWYSTDGRRLGDYLAGLAPDVMIVAAELYDHVATGKDNEDERNPLLRMGWRKRHHGALPKVCARLRPDLTILAGNHGATVESGAVLRVGGLCVRHFSWRTEEQYLRKIANGARAYAATDLPEDTGLHWRMHGDPDDPGFDERVRAHFCQWFYFERPNRDDSLIYDPAPLYMGT